MRLIDADIVENIIMNWAVNESKQGNKNIASGAMEAALIIKNAKTVDVAPVKHGHWEMYRTYYRCSNCLCQDAIGLAPYCKNCGARMDNGVI